MTRDAPTLLGTTELRDVSLAPSAVHTAQITISHPQLRDLILPLRRGKVLFPHRTAIYELRHDDDEDGLESDDATAAAPKATSRELFKLSFVPTCITSNGAIFACGGQKAELFMCDLPQEGLERAPPVKPFQLSMRLQSGCINNAIAILPSFPSGWAERQSECRRRYASREDEDLEDDWKRIDDDDESSDYDLVDLDEVQSPAVATFPNSMPFGHPSRMPQPQVVTSRRSTPSTCSSRPRTDVPRILVSNNDKTVKMFSLRSAAELPRHSDEWEPPAAMPATSAMRQTQAEALWRMDDALGRRDYTSSSPSMPLRIYDDTPIHGREETLTLRNTRYLGESASAYRARNPAGDDEVEARLRRNMRLRQERAAEINRRDLLRDGGGEPRKLSLVGGTRFKVPVNHASLSPDLRTMVTVGDSTDVYLYEAIDGGRNFRKIGVYNAATDWCFSTSWSKDGRKFAVASQDGQVTVWDHRSSRPLAVFYSSPSKRTPHDHDHDHHLQEEVSSSSGREAARVVKFSPEGSSRDLLVFSEEYSNVHVIDARTFDTHVVLPVPTGTDANPTPERRHGVDTPHWGISGVAFDPTGDTLYAGTERTIVEWDLRRHGGGEGGTWSMA